MGFRGPDFSFPSWHPTYKDGTQHIKKLGLEAKLSLNSGVKSHSAVVVGPICINYILELLIEKYNHQFFT